MEDNAGSNGHVRVHLIVGKVEIEIESSEASIEKVFDRVAGLIEVLPDSVQRVEGTGQPGSGTSEMQSTGSANTVAVSPAIPGDGLDQKKHRTPSTAKPEYLRKIDLGISPEQMGAFRDFYEEKAPVGQNDQVLTVMSWLSRNLGSPKLIRDQIFTGLRMVDEKVPKRLQSVISNLLQRDYILKDGDGYVMHHTGEDHVEKDLPAKDNGTA